MVREWVNQRKNMLEQVCGISIGETDFTDDRLAIVLKRLSEPQTWLAIETELTRNSIRIYELPTSTMRMDATTMSGYHLVSEEGLFQWGHKLWRPEPSSNQSDDGQSRPQQNASRNSRSFRRKSR